MPRMKKKLLGSLVVFGGLSLGGFAIFEFNPTLLEATFDFSKKIFITTNIDIPTDHELEEQKNWDDAQSAITGFHRKWNLHQYEAAREYLAEEARSKPQYSVEEMKKWITEDLIGTQTISDLHNEIGESGGNTKVISFKKTYVLKSPEPEPQVRIAALKAYLIQRDEKWLIQTIEDERL